MTDDELQSILDKHRRWIMSEGEQGERAILRDANLGYANARGYDLRCADLRYCNLGGAVLQRALLQGSDLRYCNLGGAILRDASLQGASLHGANLGGVNLQGAKLHGATLPPHQVCPEEGAFIAFKKLSGGAICKLKVPSEAKRVTSIGQRKCRVEYADVIEGEGYPDCKKKDPYYKPGERVYPDKFDDDERVACSNGIHVFITRQEAEEW